MGSKINQKSIKNSMKNRRRFWMGCGWLLGPIFDGFWVQVGGQVGAKLAPTSEEMGYQDDVKKSSKIWSRGGQQPENVLAPNNTTILTILTVLAAGSWLAVQSPIDTPVGHKARGRIFSWYWLEGYMPISMHCWSQSCRPLNPPSQQSVGSAC